MGSNVNIVNNFFEAVSIGSEFELREMLDAQGQEITIDAAKSYNEKGETPLLVAIRRKHFRVVQFLVSDLKVNIGQNGRFSWKEFDHLEVPPLFAAIISGQVAIVDYLISVENLDSFLPSIAMSSIMSSSISRQEKIDALELMGSAYILYGEETARRYGLPCWMQAMNLRQSTTRGQPVIPKILQHSSELVRKAMGDVVEVNTLQQLVHLLTAETHMQLITQANIVSYRILKEISPGPNLFTLTHLLSYNNYYWSENDFGRVVNISMLILESFDLGAENQHLPEMNGIINSTLNILSNSFLMLRREPPNTNGREEFSFANLMKAVEFAFAHCRSWTNEFQGRLTDSMNEWALWPDNYIVDLIVLLHEMHLSQQESHRFRQSTYHFISADHRSSYKRNLLHMTCLMPVISTDVIQLLLELGTDPNATDQDGNTPLHLLAKNHWTYFNTNAARIIMNFGGHLDHANKFNTTVLERLKYRMRNLVRQGRYDPNLQSLINSVLPLSCCSARVIRQNQIDIRALPPSLQSFVRQH